MGLSVDGNTPEEQLIRYDSCDGKFPIMNSDLYLLPVIAVYFICRSTYFSMLIGLHDTQQMPASFSN